MEHSLAMQIAGGVALLIGLRMNIDPIGFNKSIFGDVEGIESGESSAMRMAIGGGLLALGIVNIYCSFNVEDAAASEAILTGTAMGLAAFLATVAAPSSGAIRTVSLPCRWLFSRRSSQYACTPR